MTVLLADPLAAKWECDILFTVKVLRTIALLALSIFTLRGEAGEVRWNVFDLTMDGSMYYPPLDGQAAGYYGGDITPEIGFLYNRNQQGRITSITAAWELMNCGANANTWVLANYGDELITSADFLAKTSVFENTITVPTRGTEFYLAFKGILFDYDEQIGMTELPYYGWVNLGVTRTDGLYVNNSAVSIGNPIAVGSYSALSTPEPTSGLLLLVGSALLLIRRRS